MGIPAILAGILTQLALYSINLKIMGKANQSINVDKYDLLISLRWVKEFALHNPIVMVILVTAALIGVLYWFFGTELGCAHPCHRLQPCHVPRTGHQHQLQCGAGSGRLQWSGRTVRCAAEPSIRALQMSAWAAVPSSSVWLLSSSVRPCFGRIFQNFALKLVSVVAGCDHLLHRHPAGADRLGFDANLLKAAQCLRGGHLPGDALLEEPVLRKADCKKKEGAKMLEIQNVSKTFNAGTVNEKTALNGLNLKLNEGDFVTVIGGNGAGKSTMLNAVAGVWPIDEGKIFDRRHRRHQTDASTSAPPTSAACFRTP